MTKEGKKIQEFITEHRDFLAANNIDVAYSIISDEWFVYQTQSEYGYYEYFIQFSTVSELVDIILDEMRFALYSAIEKEIAPPKYDDDKIINILTSYHPFENTKQDLTVLLDTILSTEIGKNSRFFQVLDKMLTVSSNNQTSKTK